MSNRRNEDDSWSSDGDNDTEPLLGSNRLQTGQLLGTLANRTITAAARHYDLPSSSSSSSLGILEAVPQPSFNPNRRNELENLPPRNNATNQFTGNLVNIYSPTRDQENGEISSQFIEYRNNIINRLLNEGRIRFPSSRAIERGFMEPNEILNLDDFLHTNEELGDFHIGGIPVQWNAMNSSLEEQNLEASLNTGSPIIVRPTVNTGSPIIFRPTVNTGSPLIIRPTLNTGSPLIVRPTVNTGLPLNVRSTYNTESLINIRQTLNLGSPFTLPRNMNADRLETIHLSEVEDWSRRLNALRDEHGNFMITAWNRMRQDNFNFGNRDSRNYQQQLDELRDLADNISPPRWIPRQQVITPPQNPRNVNILRNVRNPRNVVMSPPSPLEGDEHEFDLRLAELRSFATQNYPVTWNHVKSREPRTMFPGLADVPEILDLDVSDDHDTSNSVVLPWNLLNLDNLSVGDRSPVSSRGNRSTDDESPRHRRSSPLPWTHMSVQNYFRSQMNEFGSNSSISSLENISMDFHALHSAPISTEVNESVNSPAVNDVEPGTSTQNNPPEAQTTPAPTRESYRGIAINFVTDLVNSAISTCLNRRPASPQSDSFHSSGNEADDELDSDFVDFYDDEEE